MKTLGKIKHDKNMLIIQLSKEGQKICEKYERDDHGCDLISFLGDEPFADDEQIERIQELIEYLISRNEKLKAIEQSFKIIGQALK